MSRLYFTYKGRFTLQDFLNLLVTVFLFMAFMNFVTRNYYWLFFAFAFFAITPKRTVMLNFSVLFLLILGVSMLIFDPSSRNSVTNILKPFVFFMAYTIGTGLVSDVDDGQAAALRVEKIIYTCALGFFAHYLLNFISNAGSLQRNTIDFWTNEILSATGQASLACICVAVAIADLFSNTTIKRRITAVVLLIVVIAYNLILAGRTLLLLIAILFLFALTFRSIYYKKTAIKSVLVTIVLLTILLVLYNLDVFNIKSTIEESNFYLRFFGKGGFDITEDPRFEYKQLYLEHLWEYPFGGLHIRTMYSHYAHDLYLDTYDQYGVVVFMATVAYIISSIIRLIKALRHPMLSFRTKQLVLCIYVLLNIQFWLEPVMAGMPFLLVAYCLIDGVMSRFLANQSRYAYASGGDV